MGVTDISKLMGWPTPKNRRLRLFGDEYLLIDMGGHGPIATEEQYENFQESFAYLRDDGSISRYGELIGTRDDIEWLDD